jgi:hypothetical protein
LPFALKKSIEDLSWSSFYTTGVAIIIKTSLHFDGNEYLGVLYRIPLFRAVPFKLLLQGVFFTGRLLKGLALHASMETKQIKS